MSVRYRQRTGDDDILLMYGRLYPSDVRLDRSTVVVVVVAAAAIFENELNFSPVNSLILRRVTEQTLCGADCESHTVSVLVMAALWSRADHYICLLYTSPSPRD